MTLPGPKWFACICALVLAELGPAWAVVGKPVDLSLLPPALERTIDFEKEVRPIFAKHCAECHGAEKQKSGLRLDRKSAALRGGDLGTAIAPGKIAESPLLHYTAGLVPDMIMPPKGERLSVDEVAILRTWIEQGAHWPDDGADENKEKWWSLRPLQRSAIPVIAGNNSSNPIDAFVRAKLQERGLPWSPEADRQSLIRRLYFDLTGLPPTPEAVEQFVHNNDPRAYEELVDRLLASPAYGERWARHWLDVVHYGDTHGYDKDQPRPNAWPYRDYVIRSFNEDKRYERFVQEQLAGDVLFPGTPDGIEALGFIAAGPWDLIGHAEVPETKVDGRIARHLDRDDMVSNTMSTFNSLTVHCAQCHNHKFDPIPAEDYYSLHAVFAAVDRTNFEYYRDPELNRKRAELKAEERRLSREKEKLEEKMAKAGGEEYVALREKIARGGANEGGRPPEFGYHSAIESEPGREKWVQVDLGHSVQISRVVLAPCWDDFAGIGAGFGFPPRFKIELSDDAEFKNGVHLAHEQQKTDLKNPGTELQSFPVTNTARYIRVTATKLAPRQNEYIFALAELEAYGTEGTNLASNAEVTALDSIENPIRWTKKNLVDGIYPGKKSGPDLATLQTQLAGLEAKLIPGELRDQWTTTTDALARVGKEIAALPKPNTAFIAAVHHGSGAFRGTGPDSGKPRPISLLLRGDVRQPVRPVSAGALSAIEGLPARFDLPAEHPEGERRKALALWLTDSRNPLTWRSIVNRVWQYHFGRGIVETPNDFGRMGALPTHSELLDWLALEFRDGGQSLKTLHKLIVMSATYRQVSRVTPATEKAAATDQDNRYLWRMSRRKLEAEAVRDAVLFASGKLNAEMFGPGFRDFVVEKPEHSPHYEYHLHDPDDTRTHRRSIYRFIVRSQPQPFMATLDCADPSMLVDKRNESLSALQALALLNNGFMVSMARHFASSLEKEEPALEAQVRRAFERALGRAPGAKEEAEMLAFAREHGLANACRVLFNLNEFSFVD